MFCSAQCDSQMSVASKQPGHTVKDKLVFHQVPMNVWHFPVACVHCKGVYLNENVEKLS